MTGTTHRPPRLADERGVIRSLLIYALLIFTVIGLTLYEGGQVLVAQIKAQSVAGKAAQAGAETYSRAKGARRVDQARAAAEAAASEEDADTRVLEIVVGRDGSVTVTTEKEALTLIIDRVSFLRELSLRKATIREGPLPP